MTDYKTQHIDFVSDNNGSSIIFIMITILHIPLSLFLYIGCLPSKELAAWKYCVMEVAMLASPIFMVLLEPLASQAFVTFMFFVVIVGIVYFRLDTPSSSVLNTSERTNSEVSFVSHFKGALMMMTCFSILMVDFPVFPRYHAKTERYGISLMDIGIGGFIFSSGLTSSFARGESISKVNDKERGRDLNRRRWRVASVVALGLLRLISLKALNYHEHVTEYGKHWNFFLTLATVWMSADTLHSICPPSLVGIVAITVPVLYHIHLETSGLELFIFNGPRTNWINSNREGIVSLCGFFGIYLAAEVFARNFLFDKNSLTASGDSTMKHISRLRFMVSPQGGLQRASVGTWIAYVLITIVSDPSRRLTNLPFVLGVLAICFTTLFTFAIIDNVLGYTGKTSHLLQSFNQNQLPLFLVANVLTGLVNYLFQTIYMNSLLAYLVLGIYALILCGIAIYLKRKII